MKNRLIILFNILSFGFIQAQTTTVNLICARDLSLGYHDNYNTENNNYGYAQQTASFVIPGASGGVNSNRGLLDFDLSSIPPGADIIEAKINLYALVGTLNSPVNQGHFGANASYLRRVTGNWSENSTTWNSAPAYTSLNQVILPQSTSASQDYLGVLVTDMVQDMIDNPGQSHGFWLGLIDEELPSKALLFCSIDHGIAAKYPTLDITYRPSSAGVSELQDNLFEIYPNPATNSVIILNKTFVNENAVITDFLGKVVMQIELSNYKTEIDLSVLPKGAYTIQTNKEIHSLIKL